MYAGGPATADGFPERSSALARWWQGRAGKRLLIEAVLVFSLLTFYRVVRQVVADRVAQAVENGYEVMRIERAIGIFTESGLQQFALHSAFVPGLLRVGVQEDAVRFQDPPRFGEKAGAVGVVVRRLNIQKHVDASVGKGQVHGAAFDKGYAIPAHPLPLAIAYRACRNVKAGGFKQAWARRFEECVEPTTAAAADL